MPVENASENKYLVIGVRNVELRTDVWVGAIQESLPHTLHCKSHLKHFRKEYRKGI